MPTKTKEEKLVLKAIKDDYAKVQKITVLIALATKIGLLGGIAKKLASIKFIPLKVKVFTFLAITYYIPLSMF